MKKNCAKTAGIINIIIHTALTIAILLFVIATVLGMADIEIPAFLEQIYGKVYWLLLLPLNFLFDGIGGDLEVLVLYIGVAVIFIFAIIFMVWAIKTVKYSKLPDADFKAKRPRLIKYIVFYILGLLYLLFNSYCLISLAGFFPNDILILIAIYLPVILLVSTILLCIDTAKAKRI